MKGARWDECKGVDAPLLYRAWDRTKTETQTETQTETGAGWATARSLFLPPCSFPSVFPLPRPPLA